MLHNITFKKLENGYTVKYRIADNMVNGQASGGYAKEIYVRSKDEIVKLIEKVVQENVE